MVGPTLNARSSFMESSSPLKDSAIARGCNYLPQIEITPTHTSRRRASRQGSWAARAHGLRYLSALAKLVGRRRLLTPPEAAG
jgi:hypothetical protein